MRIGHFIHQSGSELEVYSRKTLSTNGNRALGKPAYDVVYSPRKNVTWIIMLTCLQRFVAALKNRRNSFGKTFRAVSVKEIKS